VKALNVSDALYNTIRRLAYEAESAVDEYADDLLRSMLSAARPAPKNKNEMMAAILSVDCYTSIREKGVDRCRITSG
jgi:hypothetical protein